MPARAVRTALILLGLLASLVAAPTVVAQESDTIFRVEGPTRIQTAIAISQQGYPDGQARGVVLTTSDNFPDAQAGATLAAWVALGPLLLTSPGSLHPDTATELRRVIGSSGVVFLLGGPAALSANVEQQVRDLGFSTERLAGDSRDTTALAIAERTNPNPQRIFVADGEDFTTSLVAGPVAAQAVGNASSVVVLSQGRRASAALTDYLAQHRSAEVIAIGRNAAEAVPSARPITGATPAALSVAVATEFPPPPGFAQSGGSFGLASNDNWPDGLAGGAYAGTFGFNLLLTPGNDIAEEVEAFIEARGFTIGFLFGGPAALSTSVQQAAQAAVARGSGGSGGTGGGGSDPGPERGWVLESARPLNGDEAFPGQYDNPTISLGGGAASRMVQTSAGTPPGHWSFTWSWGQPPEVISPDQTVSLDVALTHGDIEYTGGYSGQFNVRGEVLSGETGGVLASPNITPFPLLTMSCSATDDGSTDCELQDTNRRGTLEFSLGSGREGNVRIFRWIVANCGTQCAVDWTYVYRE